MSDDAAAEPPGHSRPSPAGTELPSKRVSIESVLAAAQSLRELGLSRDQVSTFIRWLFRKRAGLRVPDGADETPVSPAVWTGELCSTFAHELLGLTSGPDRYYNPLNGQRMGSASSDWAIQVLYTQLQRANQREKRMYAGAREVTAADLLATSPNAWTDSVTSSSQYLSELSSLLGPKRVPLEPLALWRYRYDTLPGNQSLDDLVERLVNEYGISSAERAALFADEETVPDAPLETVSTDEASASPGFSDPHPGDGEPE